MYLKSLRLTNFEIHRDTTVEFSPNLTYLCGNCDTGKSSIIRGLLLLLTNTPDRGADYVTLGQDFSSVVGVFVDKDNTEVTVTRKRENDRNYYVLEIPGKETLEYVGVTQIPDTIAEVFNLDDTIQEQFEDHYLIFSSHGKVGKVFRKAVGLEPVDKLNTELKNTLDNTRKSLGVCELAQTNYNIQLDDLAGMDLDGLESDLNIIGSDLHKLEALNYAVLELTTLINDCSRVELEIERLSKSPSFEYVRDLLEDSFVEYQDSQKLLRELSTSILDLKKIEDYLGYIHIVEVPDMSVEFDRLNVLKSEIVNIRTLIKDLDTNSANIINLTNSLNQLASDCAEIEAQLQGTTCEKCGTILTDQALQHYLGSL